MPMLQERLRHLLASAADLRPETRGALADEVRALLMDWPENHDAAQRAPFEALLEKLTADREHDVLEAARAGDMQGVVRGLASLSHHDADEIHSALRGDGHSLAQICADAHLPRAAFSAIAILVGPARDAALHDAGRILSAFASANDQATLAAE